MSGHREIFLTFDVEGPPFMEDSMDQLALKSLMKILQLMEKYELEGLFFITGSIAEEIAGHSAILELLEKHSIGYHSSSHSVSPMIFEYTDLEDYNEAVEVAFERETSRIDCSSGRILGKGGILLLQEIFAGKKIESFRAPFLCWTPPHLEALKDLGVKFDFSAGLIEDLTFTPVEHKGITFYPHPIQVDSIISSIGHIRTYPRKHAVPNLLFSDVVRGKCIVLMRHPAVLACRTHRSTCLQGDTLMHDQVRNEPRTHFDFASQILGARLLFSELKLMQETGMAKITPPLKMANATIDPKKIDVKMICKMSLSAPERLFNFKPRFLPDHFQRFFD